MEVWELIARESIRDLVARYNSAGDAGRIDDLLALFGADASLEVDGDVRRGRAAVRERFAAAAASTRRRPGALLRHFTATHQIDLADRQSATGRSYFLVLTENGLDHWGRYLDEYVCVAGPWRFARRVVRLDGRVPGGWADGQR